MLYIFDDYTVDTQREILSRAGQPIPLEPHALKLLIYLLQHHDRVVVRQELLDHLWPGRHGTAATLEQSIKVVRDALEDSALKLRSMRTRHRRGYRFVGAVQQRDRVPAGDERQRVSPKSPCPGPPEAPPQRATNAVSRLPQCLRRLRWLAPAAGVLTLCGALFWSHARQPGAAIAGRTMPRVEQIAQDSRPSQEEPPPVPPPAASPPEAPVASERDHTPPPAAERTTTPVTPEQDQSPRLEEMYYEVVLTLHAAGFLCQRPRQSPCLRDVTVRDTGEVRLAGILCDSQDEAQVHTLLAEIPGVRGVVMEEVNLKKQWVKDRALPECVVRPWHKPSGSTP